MASVADRVDAGGDHVDRSGEPLIRAEGVWKIFGRHADQIIGTPDAELPRAELREKTGCVAAVRDVSFEVWPGRGLRRDGPLRLGQVDARAHADPADRADRGPDRDRRPGRDRRRAAPSCAQLRRHTSSMVFQHFGLLAHRRVIDNVAFGLEVQGVPKAKRLARAAEVLQLVGLEDVGEPVPRPALRRDAAARRPRTRVRRRPEGDALRRAVQRARPADPARHAGRGDPAPARDGQDDGLHHPRPARGAAPRRPDRDHARRRDRPARHARRTSSGRLPTTTSQNFVRDIPRSHVLTLRWIMRDRRRGRGRTGPTLDVGDDGQRRRAADRRQRAAGLRRRERPRRRRRRPRRRPDRRSRARATEMATVARRRRSRRGSLPRRLVARQARARRRRSSRRDARRLLRLEGPMPVAGVARRGTRCRGYLDRFQNWLSDRAQRPRTRASSSRSSTASRRSSTTSSRG